MSDNLMLAILAMDSYNRGPEQQLFISGTQLGNATLLDLPPSAEAQSSGFYATAYTWTDENGNPETVISYRGTNIGSAASFIADATNGFGVGAGFGHGPQAVAAIQFFQQVAEAEDPSLAPGGADAGDWQSANIVLTGHSLGGGLAGFVGAIYDEQATLFDNMTFNTAANTAFHDALTSNASFQAASDPDLNTGGNEVPILFPGWAQFVYGAAAGNPYAPNQTC